MSEIKVSDDGVGGVVSRVTALSSELAEGCGSAIGRAEQSLSKLDGGGVAATQRLHAAVREMTEVFTTGTARLAVFTTQAHNTVSEADVTGKQGFAAVAGGKRGV